MGIRLVAILAIALLAVYHAMRIVAARCSGPQCDALIPLSLLLPLLILIADAATGVAAGSAAWQRTREATIYRNRRREAAWLALLIVCALVSVVGPLVSLAIFRDSPDQFVASATALAALIPVVALIFSYAASASDASSQRS